jgi:hypothetical protein
MAFTADVQNWALYLFRYTYATLVLLRKAA